MRKNGQILNFKEFSQFESIEEFNRHMKLWLSVHSEEYTKGEIMGLTRLFRYCAKVVGVANMKIATILKTIHEEFEGNGISRSTFKRMIVKAKTTGMITVIELKRDSGGQSSNLYVFNRYSKLTESVKSFKQPHCLLKNANKATKTSTTSSFEPPSKEQLNHHKTKENYKTNHQKTIKKRKETLDHTFTSDFVPPSFKTLAKSFFDCCETIEEYWKMVRISAYKHACEDDINLTTQIGIDSFKQLIRAMKKKAIRNPIAYFYGVLNKKFNHVYVSELAEITTSAVSLPDPGSPAQKHWLDT